MKISEVEEFKDKYAVEPPPLPPDLTQSKIRFIWLLNITLVIASILVWVGVNSILITMPLAALIGLLAAYRCKDLEKFYKFIFYSPLMIISIGLLIIFTGELNERQDAEIFAAIINFPTGCVLLLSIDKLWASVKS